MDQTKVEQQADVREGQHSENKDDDGEVTLISGDDKRFVVSKKVAAYSEVLKGYMEDLGDCDISEFPTPNVDGQTLERVIDFCKFHAELSSQSYLEQELQVKAQDYNQKFMKSLDQKSGKQGLFLLILKVAIDPYPLELWPPQRAANYLNVSKLLDLACQSVADKIKGKSPQAIREEFGIQNDFTPEEEEQVRRENEWAFD